MTAIARIFLILALAGTTAAIAKPLPRPRAEEPRSSECAAFGPGFRKLDGADTCVKIDGHIRVESTYSSGGGSFAPSGSTR